MKVKTVQDRSVVPIKLSAKSKIQRGRMPKCLIALACLFSMFTAKHTAHAFSLEDIQMWAGSGTNQAALIIHWSAPEVRNNSSVESAIANHSLAWGFRWNDAATAEQMLSGVAATDVRLVPVVSSPSQFGLSVLGFVFDLNGNGIVGLKNGTNVFTKSATNGFITINFGGADVFQSLDPGDLYWGGWNGANWELWSGRNAMSNGTNMPDRGFESYWNRPAGTHGEWRRPSVGVSSLALTNGLWIGWTVGAGGADFVNPNSPGNVANRLHKHAPKPPAAATPPSSPYATHLVQAQGPFGPAPYDDPNAVLGMPATDFYDPFGVFSGGDNARFVKLVEPAFNVSTNQSTKLITTLCAGASNSSMIAGFEQPISDDPAHPYGIDFLVFGNAFYGASGATHDSANMNTLMIGGGGFYEPLKVSVSPGYTGSPGETIDDSTTWPWYRYDNGPFADTEFPTHAYKWNRAATNWSAERMDFTKPVNPALTNVIRLGAPSISAADAIDYYAGSGGGTGFDLRESGFSIVRYIKVEGLSPDYADGEVDAFSVVRPAALNDQLSVSPANLTNGLAVFRFQQPAALSNLAAAITFTSLDRSASLRVSAVNNSEERAGLPAGILSAVRIDVVPIIGSNLVAFAASAQLGVGPAYAGSGTDLHLFRREGTNWIAHPFVFNATNNTLAVNSLTSTATCAVVQTPGVPLQIVAATNGTYLHYEAMPGWRHTVEVTTNFVAWQSIASSFSMEPSTMDAPLPGNSPSANAFYRLRLELP
jgi:hypothetical protein